MEKQKQAKADIRRSLRPYIAALGGLALEVSVVGMLGGCSNNKMQNAMPYGDNNLYALQQQIIEKNKPPEGLKSPRWSGYVTFPFAGERSHGKITEVMGSWAVAYGNAYDPLGEVEQWVGLGGYYKNDGLIQAGTGFSDKMGYFAWYETLSSKENNPEVIVKSLAVKPNDVMSADIKRIGGDAWKITIKDDTTGKEISSAVRFNEKVGTAEWIVEIPKAHIGYINKPFKAPFTFNMHLSQFGSAYFGHMTNKFGQDCVTIEGKRYSPDKLNPKTISVDGVSVSRLSKDQSFEVSDNIPPFCVNGFVHGAEISVGRPLKAKNLEMQLIKVGNTDGKRWAMIFTSYTESIPGTLEWKKTIGEGGVTEYYQTEKGGGVVQCSNLSAIPMDRESSITMLMEAGVERVYVFPKYVDDRTIMASVVLERAMLVKELRR